MVALNIIQDIVLAGLKPGDALPPEAGLVERYGVSRPSLREALRVLEFQGLVQIRPGPGSSTIVGTADSRNLARTILLYLHVAGVSYDEVLLLWCYTEPLLVEFASRNPDRERVRKEMAVFIHPDHEVDQREGVDFHDKMAELSDYSRVVALICHAVAVAVSAEILSFASTSRMPETLQHDHVNIAEAVAAGDAERARVLMAEHCNRVAGEFRAAWPGLVGERRLDWSAAI